MDFHALREAYGQEPLREEVRTAVGGPAVAAVLDIEVGGPKPAVISFYEQVPHVPNPLTEPTPRF